MTAWAATLADVASEGARRKWGYIVWGVTGLAIAVPEIWAAKWPDNARFPTISGTVGYIEYWHDWVALLVIGVLVWAAFLWGALTRFPLQNRWVESD